VIPISFLFWGYVTAYVVHILEESVLRENFVEKVRNKYWQEYSWTKFFWFNTFLLLLNIVAILLYEVFGGAWIIFPLSLACERILNGGYHLFETIKYRTFSSGLLTSVLFWIPAYFILRYAILKGEILHSYVIISIIIGGILTFFMFFSLYLVSKK
jgi:hypothetical protein